MKTIYVLLLVSANHAPTQVVKRFPSLEECPIAAHELNRGKQLGDDGYTCYEFKPFHDD